MEWENPQLLGDDNSNSGVECYMDCLADNICDSSIDFICDSSADDFDLRIQVASGSRTYDGTALTANSYSVVTSKLKEGDKLSVTVTGSITDAGTKENTAICTIKRGEDDVTGEYRIKIVPGTLTVTPCQVTLTSASAEKIYDGTPLTNDTVTVSGAGWVAGEGATYTVTGSQTEVGTSKNLFDYTLADNTNPLNYNITQVFGILKVTPRTAITITADSVSKVYDGKALTAGYTFAGVKEGDTVVATVSGSITDAGETANKVTSYKVMRGEADVTGEYAVTTYDGTLTVTQRQVTLTSASAKKTYDGMPLTDGTVTVSGADWAAGEGATYTVTGSQTEVGTSKNLFDYTLADNTNPLNYIITKEEGDLTVVSSSAIAITVTTSDAQKAYNGKPLTSKKYTVSGKTQKGDKLIVTVTGIITDIGEAKNTATWQVMRGKTDVSGEYDVTVVPGTLTVIYGSTYMIDGKEETIDGNFLKQDFKKLTVQNGGVLRGGEVSFGAKELILKSGTVAGDLSKINIGKLSVSDTDNVINGAVAVDSLSVAAGKQIASTLTVNGALSCKAKNAKFSAGNNSDLTLRSVALTSGNDTLSIGKDSAFTADSLDFGAGNDKLTVGASAQVEINGDITGITTLSGAAGKGKATTLRVQNVTFDTRAKNAKMTFGNNSIVELAKLQMATGGSSLSIGKDSTFKVNEIGFRENQKNTISVGSNSVFRLNGDAYHIGNLTLANGGAELYAKDLGAEGQNGKGAKFTFGKDSKVEVDGNISMWNGNDTLSIGKDSTFTAQAIELRGGNDKLTISGGEFTAEKLDFGAGNDTLSFGGGLFSAGKIDFSDGNDKLTISGGTFTAASLDFGLGNDTLNIGKGATLSVDNLVVDNLDKLTMGKDSVLWIADAGDFKAAQDKWGEKYRDQIKCGKIC